MCSITCTHCVMVRRHYVNALVHRATGVQGATALVARHAFRQTRCQRSRWVHCLADFAHALTDPRSWPRIRAAGQVCHTTYALRRQAVCHKHTVYGLRARITRDTIHQLHARRPTDTRRLHGAYLPCHTYISGVYGIPAISGYTLMQLLGRSVPHGYQLERQLLWTIPSPFLQKSACCAGREVKQCWKLKP